MDVVAVFTAHFALPYRMVGLLVALHLDISVSGKTGLSLFGVLKDTQQVGSEIRLAFCVYCVAVCAGYILSAVLPHIPKGALP